MWNIFLLVCAPLLQWSNLLDKFSTDLQRALPKEQSGLIDEAKLSTTFYGMVACFIYIVYRATRTEYERCLVKARKYVSNYAVVAVLTAVFALYVVMRKLLNRVVPDQKFAAMWLAAANVCFAFVFGTALTMYRPDKTLSMYSDITYFVAQFVLAWMLKDAINNEKHHSSLFIAGFTVFVVINMSILFESHCEMHVILYTICMACLNLWLDEFNMRISPEFAMMQHHLNVVVNYWIRKNYGDNTIFETFNVLTWHVSAFLLVLLLVFFIFFSKIKNPIKNDQEDNAEDNAEDDFQILPKSFHGERAYMILLVGWFFLAPVYLGWLTRKRVIYICVGCERVTSTLTGCLLDHLRTLIRKKRGQLIGNCFDVLKDFLRILAMFPIVESVNKEGNPVGHVPPILLVLVWMILAPFVIKIYGMMVKNLTQEEDKKKD